MSIKKIILFVLLLLICCAGGYITVFGIKGCFIYSGVERDFNIMNPNELQSNLNVKGEIETTLGVLGADHVANNFLGLPLGKDTLRYYFMIQLGYEENDSEQKYAVIAADKPEDVEFLRSIEHTEPQPPDKNAPRFEFSGVVMDITPKIRTNMYDLLWELYDTEYNIYNHKNVDGNLVPYTIYVKNGTDDNYLTAMITGGAITLASAAAFVILAVVTYKQKYRYC